MRRWQIMPKFEICGQLERIAIFHLVFALMLWFKKKDLVETNGMLSQRITQKEKKEKK